MVQGFIFATPFSICMESLHRQVGLGFRVEVIVEYTGY